MKSTSKSPLVVLSLLVLGLTSVARAQDQEKKESAATVEVTLTEYAIEMPESLPAGPTTFVIHNEGQKSHSFVLQGEGSEEKLSESLRPHATANLEVDLKPGTYKVYCPIGSHEAKGMARTVVVKGK
jgi:plastocyanin